MDKIVLHMEYRELLRYSGSLTLNGLSFCRVLNDWIVNERYKKHYNKDKDRWYECETFTEFMEVSPPKGLGLSFLDLKPELSALSSITDDAKAIIAKWMKEGGKQKDVAEKLGVNKSTISRKLSSGQHSNKNTRNFGWMPVSPADAAKKIREKFGNEFADNLQEALYVTATGNSALS